MANRKDGIATKQRLMESACKLFAEKGLRDTTVAEICEAAGANVAAVNYHFGDKESLYIESWRLAHSRANELYPYDAVPSEAPVAQRLAGHIHALLRRMTDDGRLGQFHRMFMTELANPTGLLDTLQTIWKPARQHMIGLLREMLGEQVSDEQLQFCELSIINQCRGLSARMRRPLPPIADRPMTDELVTRLANHITQFSIAGIAAVRALAEGADRSAELGEITGVSGDVSEAGSSTSFELAIDQVRQGAES